MQIPEWQKYWNETGPKLLTYLNGNSDPLMVTYLVNCIGFYSYLTENWEKKTTKNSELRGKLSIFLVETQDLMRGVLASYEHMTMAPIALLLRTAFEIHVIVKFIMRSDDPAKWADLFDRFQYIEQILGARASIQLPDPTDEDLKRVAEMCPEWFEPGTIKFRDRRPHWTASNTDLRKMAETAHVNLGDKYVDLYKINSKFTHASPLIRNMYRKDNGLHSIPSREQCGILAMIAMGECIEVLKQSCDFFGVDFPGYDYAIICNDAIESISGKCLDPNDFPS